jgi:hypothetical protein
MENFLEELNVQRRATIENIEKSFGIDIEKARSGVYADTAENRKLNRVGQHYGGSKQEQPTAGQPRSKKQNDEQKGGSKQNHDANPKAGIYDKMSDDEKLQINKVLKFAKDNGFNDINKIEIKSDFNGSEKTLDFYYDGKNIANVGKRISEETAKKIGWLKEDGNKGSSGGGDNGGDGSNNKYANMNDDEFIRMALSWDTSTLPKKALKDKSFIESVKKNADEYYKDKSTKELRSEVKSPYNFSIDTASAAYELKRRGDFSAIDAVNKIHEIKENVPKNSLNIMSAVKNYGEGNGGDFITTKRGINALKKLRKSVSDFAKNNPHFKIDADVAEDLIELENDEFVNIYGKCNGLDDLKNSLEEYFEVLQEYTGDEDEEREELKFEKELRKRKDDAQKDVIAALEADQGGLLDDEDSKKKIEAIKQAAAEFVEKNPDLKITTNGWETIVDGLNINKYKKYDGFEKLNSCIENYF